MKLVEPIKAPSASCAEALRELLHRAEDGEIIAIAIAYECRDASHGREYVADGMHNSSVLIGCMERLKAAIIWRTEN